MKLLICEKLNSDELMEASGSIAPGLAMANGPLSGPHSPKTLKQKLFVSASLDPGSGQDHSKVLHKILKSTDHCIGVTNGIRVVVHKGHVRQLPIFKKKNHSGSI